jgi:hypothetical protein
MLAIVYAVEKFNDYTFGRKVTVYSDHKPLESILKKPLHRAQGMMTRLQKYDIEVKCEKGSNMFLADTLSRASITGDEKSGPEFETHQHDEVPANFRPTVKGNTTRNKK